MEYYWNVYLHWNISGIYIEILIEWVHIYAYIIEYFSATKN